MDIDTAKRALTALDLLIDEQLSAAEAELAAEEIIYDGSLLLGDRAKAAESHRRILAIREGKADEIEALIHASQILARVIWHAERYMREGEEDDQ
jgi:hypothetical protein